MGPLPTELVTAGYGSKVGVRCWDEVVNGKRFKQRLDSCLCLAHEIAREWYVVTGDSYMVHTTLVTSGKGAAGYMAKYLVKQWDVEDRYANVGMERRWSSSRGWPGSGRLRLAYTDNRGWANKMFVYGHAEEGSLGGPEDLTERSGTNLSLEMAKKRQVRSAAKQIVRMAKYD